MATFPAINFPMPPACPASGSELTPSPTQPGPIITDAPPQGAPHHVAGMSAAHLGPSLFGLQSQADLHAFRPASPGSSIVPGRTCSCSPGQYPCPSAIQHVALGAWLSEPVPILRTIHNAQRPSFPFRPYLSFLHLYIPTLTCFLSPTWSGVNRFPLLGLSTAWFHCSFRRIAKLCKGSQEERRVGRYFSCQRLWGLDFAHSSQSFTVL